MSDLSQNQNEEQSNWQNKFKQLSKYPTHQETLVKPVRIDPAKRAVALLIDIFISYVLGIIVTIIPFINTFIHAQLVMVLFLLVRDYFFHGRGIGKNLMGLQTVDVMSGQAASLAQSIKRNIVILGPVLLLYLANSIVRIISSFTPIPQVSETISSLITAIGTIYTIIVIPIEAYRVCTRADGLRLGDKFAGVAVVESQMDFSHF
jgi:uncharacterized RDD family membrane protein YckC